LARKRASSALKKAAREVMLLCTTANISSENQKRLSWVLTDGIDWEYLLKLVEFHGIMPLVAYNLTRYNFRDHIPEPYLERLSGNYNNTLYRNMLLSKELVSILSAFRKDGVAVIPLKGTVLTEVLYENPASRKMVDMDILVHPEDTVKARSILAELGYIQMPEKPHWDHQFHEVPYCKQGAFPFFLELHQNLEDRRLVTVPEADIWRRSQSFELQGISATVLSPEDNLLFLATHLCKHSDELLKFLGDIAELLKKYQDTLDWDYIVASARSWQTDIAVYYAARRAKDLLGAPVSAFNLAALKPGLWRRFLLGLLVSREDYITPNESNRLRQWTSALARGLMMRHPRQTLIVLSRQQGPWKRGAWLRTVFWVTIVLAAAAWRNGTRTVSRVLL
jgi:hypothetical protein